jgi:hypothetical protein
VNDPRESSLMADPLDYAIQSALHRDINRESKKRAPQPNPGDIEIYVSRGGPFTSRQLTLFTAGSYYWPPFELCRRPSD